MSSTQAALPPRPVADADTLAYWDAVADHRLSVPRCAACGAWVWLPKPMCPQCSTPDPVWTDVTGDASLVSWTVIHAPVLPAWADNVPFTVLLVELDEGVRMVGRLMAGSTTALEVGARMRLAWRTDHGQTLPAWAPA